MRPKNEREIDLLATGELLIDFISADFTDSLADAVDFKRLPGGSPANLCMNMARLGNRTKLVATVGQDDMGDYLKELVESQGINCDHLRQTLLPTSLILVTRSKEVSNFAPYRGSDYEIKAQQFANCAFAQIALFHTTCFGLSKEPARQSILRAAQSAVSAGCQLSLDVNYAEKIWQNRTEAQAVVADYVAQGAIVKVSEVDWERLYQRALDQPQEAIEHFLQLGAKEVCLTLGGDGCWVGTATGLQYLPGREVAVNDTTGAGDAFWSGYLTAWLDGYDALRCAIAGRKMAELKLAHFGPLPSKMERSCIYMDL